jgi:hypothetical protein
VRDFEIDQWIEPAVVFVANQRHGG